MKTIEELYQEVLEKDAMKQEFAEALQDGRIMDFLKEYGCEAGQEEVNAFLKEQQEKEGELSDAELDAVSGGCSSGPAPNSRLEQRWDQEGSYTVIVCDE
ncbi:MAG TPA: hypothetical protein H9700_06775 [Candidatus Eisenbergiella intestinipullorum]|nr:hypothetical protein [Candidatus Eisenbergiella intestinipullorum]